MSVVKYKVESGIAWLTMNNPPLNALSHALRQGILAGLDRALADVKRIIRRAAQVLDNGVAVRRTSLEGLENQELQGAREEIGRGVGQTHQ